VFSNKPTDLTALSPCKQEADTRMMLHLRRDAQQGHAKAYLRTVDSDIVVLAVNVFQTRSQAVARIADRTAKNCRGHVT